MAAHASIWIEKFDRAQRILDRLIAAARDASAVSALIYPLAARSHLDFRLGRWAAARAGAAESVELAQDTGQLAAARPQPRRARPHRGGAAARRRTAGAT